MTGMNDDARYVQISERVDNHARQIADIDVRMRQGFTDIASQLRGLADDFREALEPNGLCSSGSAPWQSRSLAALAT